MKNMTIEEIKAMVGTEFLYTEGGNQIPAVIAAFDEEVGFTCLATELVSSNGTDLSDDVDENGNLCLIGLHVERFSSKDEFYKEITGTIKLINNLGYICYNVRFSKDSQKGNGSASCAF